MTVAQSIASGAAATGRDADSRRLPSPSAGTKGTVVRLLFGLIFAIDAVLKWLPGFRHQYLGNIKTAAQGQPSWLHWWFHLWINFQSGAPLLFATIVALIETSLAGGLHRRRRLHGLPMGRG